MAQTAQNPFQVKQFSATMAITLPSGQTMTQKIYKLGDAIRMDMSQRPGMHMLIVPSQQKTFMVMSPQRCMEMSAPRRRTPNPFTTQGTVQRKPLGTETVAGHACKVEQITVTPANGGKPVVMKAWEAQDLQGFPIRVEMQTERGPMRVDYQNVSLAAPDAALMAAPQGCMTMPSRQRPRR